MIVFTSAAIGQTFLKYYDAGEIVDIDGSKWSVTLYEKTSIDDPMPKTAIELIKKNARFCLAAITIQYLWRL